MKKLNIAIIGLTFIISAAFAGDGTPAAKTYQCESPFSSPSYVARAKVSITETPRAYTIGGITRFTADYSGTYMRIPGGVSSNQIPERLKKYKLHLGQFGTAVPGALEAVEQPILADFVAIEGRQTSKGHGLLVIQKMPENNPPGLFEVGISVDGDVYLNLFCQAQP
jgi:hypothetical protein